MSGKSGKKKRLGSRRVAPHQNVSSDDIHVTDDSSAAQHHVLEESSESLNVLSNPDDSKPETQQPPSPDNTMSRRKLGSSRRNKGRQFAKDSETEPYLEHREEVEEKTRGNKTVETTQTSLTAQLDRQEESSQGSVQDISATPNSSLFSASTPDYDNSEVKSPSILNSPEDVTEILTPKPGNLQADQARENETKLEKTDKSDTPQSAEMEENVGILELSHLSALSSLSAAQKLINIQLSNSKEMPGEKLSHVYSATEMGSNKNDDTDMFRQDESLQGNTLESESQVGSVALESATDKNSHRENTAVKDNAEQAMFLLPKEELPTNEKLKELFNSELKDDQRLEDTVNNVHEQDFKTTKMQKVDQDEYSPESLILDATENADICAGNLKDQAEVRDVNQLELSGKVTDDFAPKQEVLNPDDKKDEHPIKVDNLEVDFKVVFDKSVGATLEGVDKSDTGAGHSEDDVEKVQEEEGQTTEMQEMQQIDNLSASTDDATDNSKIVEIITTLPSNVMVESIDDSATEQEVSNPDDKKNEQPTKEDNLEVLVQISEDNPSCDTKTPQTSDIERVDAALVQVSESEGRVEDDVKPNPEQTFHQEAAQLFSEMENTAFSLQSFESETNAASDSQPHDSSASIHEETNTDLQQSGIRRKLGSSRRNKGRQPVKEFKEEALENTTSDEAVKIIKMSLATSQADLSQGTEHNAVPSLLHDSSMFSVSTLGYSSEVQKPAATNHPEADLGSLISKSENLQEDRETDFKVVSDKSMGATLEGVDTSDTGAHQSEDNCKIFEIITPHSSEVMVKSTEDSATEQEVSTPTVKQDEQPTKEDNLEASDQISEDNPSYDIKTPQTSDIERADTALVQVSESEGGVEDDVKPNPEQMFHHGMEQLISEMEDSKSLQSFQSETNVVFDSQPHDRSTGTDEKTNTGFQQSDIRRKLGSSRRNKGKQQVKDNKPTEEADENAKGHEPSETTETALTSETADQENSTETMLEGMNRFDTRLTEEENTQNDTHVCTSEVITSGKHSSPTVDKQVIDLSHCTQMPDEDLLGVHSVTDTENKERDEYTDLLRLDGNLPEDPLVSKTQVSPFTVEISTEKISPGEHTELEFGAEKATDSSQKDELSTKEEQLSDVSGAQQSEVAVKKVDEQDLQPTQIQDQQQKYSSPESLIVLDATEKVDTSFGNLKDQTEMRDTNMSELSRKITDDSAPKEEVSNPVTKQDERPTQERHLEALEQGNEDSDVYDSKQPRIRNTEREDTAPGQVNEGEGQVDIDVKHKDEQIVHQDDEGVISEKSTFSPQTLLSEIDAPFDSNHQDPSVSVVEETNTGFDLRGNRRKLGSSRRKKERQQDTESKEEALENTTSDEALEITQMSLGTETGIQEDLSQEAKQDAIPSVLHDSSMFLVSSPGYSEVQKPAATSHPEPDLGSLIPINKNLEEAQEDRQTDLKGMPDKSVGATLEDVDTSDTVAHQSEINVKKMQEEEGKTTEMQQIKNLSVSAIGDATDNSKIVEIITTLPSEVKVESIDDSATEQEVSNPDDKQDEQPTKEDNLEVLVQISEDNPSYDTKTPQSSDIERVDAALVQVSESDDKVEGDKKPNPEQAFHQEAAQLFSEMEDIKFPLQNFDSETNVASGSQPHDSSATIDVETNTGFQQSGIRRKLGSSRRNKGRQQFKDNKPTEEADENKIDHEPSETAKTPLTTETADQEKSAETMLEGMHKFDTHPTEEENKQLPDENLLDFYSVTDLEKGRDGAQHLEDAVKKVHDEEIKPIQKQETPQIDNISVSVIDDATNNTEILIDLTEIRDVYQSKLAVKNTDDDTKEINFESSDQGKEADRVFDTKKPQLSDTERADTALGDYVTESQVKDDIKSSAGKTGCQEAGLFSEMADTESSLQSLQHELHAALDSKPQQNNTSFSSGGNTRKLGSSQEKSMETMLEGKDKSDSAQIKDTVHVKQNEHFGPLDGISEFSSSSLHSSLVVDRQQVQSNSSEMPDKGLPIMSFVSDNKEKDENTEPLRQDGRSQGSDLFSESHVESENIESPTTMEITTEKSSSREHTKVESSVEQSLKSAPKKELASSGEQNECFNPFEVTGAEQSDDVVNKVHEELINPIQVQDLLQTDTGPKPCLQAQPSEINAPLDSKQDDPQCIKDESPTGPNPSGSRRKLGSSRRSKGRQHAKEEATESTRDDEASKTPNILATEMARQEELTDIKSPEKIRKISSTVNENDNTEKLPDKDTLSTDSSTVVTADNDFLKSNKDVDDKDKKPVKEPENLSYLTGYDTDEMDLMQPPQASVWKDDLYMQNISYHDDRSRTVDIVAQEEASQLQNTEDLLRKDADVQQTNDEIETVGHVMMESSVDKQGSGQGEVGQNFEDSTNKVGAVQEINTSHILVSTAQEPAEDVESEISTAMDASNSQEENQSDYKKNLQVKSNQRRRKLGSTRRNLLNRKQEGETDDKDETTESEVHTEANARNLDEMKDVKELVLSAEVSQNENATTLLGAVYKEQQEGYEISSAHDEGHQLESSTSSLQSSESNVIPGRDDLMALLPEPAASHTEEAVDPDRKDGERNVDIGVEPSMLEEFTSSKTQISPMIAERNRRSLDQLLPLNTDTTTNTGITGGSSVLGETTETTQNDDERAESATEIQDQDSTQQKPNVIEEAQAKTPEMKNASPNVTPTNRRRKMGSTRRNLGSRNKGEDLDNEATETEIIVGDVKTESVPVIKEKELQLHTEHNEGDPEQERLLETTEFSQAGECQPTPPTQQTVEKKPVTQGELLDTEEHSPNYLPSTSTKNDTTSMSASGRRRRKMGSHRKSHGHQGYGDQTEEQEGILDEQNETNVRSTPEEGVIKPYEEHKEEPLDLQKTSEGDDRERKPSSSIIISKPAEHSRPVSEKTPFQPSHAENRLGQEQFSLAGEPRGAGLRSDSYHVVMIGDSSVGKTSFMKRAQTGKFSLDIPSSIGLDSCMWTVMVDGKPVVLELWDTAGQERFRSITRHIFHRAQAFLLMYDITCTESFSAVSYWANCIQESAAEDVTVLLLGNKSDCAKRQVKTEQGEILAKEYNFEFMECSAATGENVVQCLETVARMLNQKIGTREEATVVQQGAAQKKRSTCC
ncbi:uncharacterized protein rab44 [Acanthochromis polyacanthus]|uniref:uncharacterized protein rab44 n=1 Tax=Acanthochromis polyacanthus TaxID=80966 RepID=UPI00223497D0|nr:uncharacterized protein rab44 [Acanthochromis polyacanthus]